MKTMMETKANKDAEAINRIIAKYSERARGYGAVIAVIVAFISLYGAKTNYLPFVLCVAYFVIEYLYHISITIMYKTVLHKYFEAIDDGFKLKHSNNSKHDGYDVEVSSEDTYANIMAERVKETQNYGRRGALNVAVSNNRHSIISRNISIYGTIEMLFNSIILIAAILTLALS